MIKLLNVSPFVLPWHMRFLRCVAPLAALAVLATRLAAAEPAATAGAAVVSQYMFRGLRVGGPALQPSVEYATGNFGAGVWGSTPLANKVPGRSDPEIDPYAWYRHALNERVSVQPGFTLFSYPRADRARGFQRTTFEPSLAVNFVGRFIAVTPKFYYDTVLRGGTAEISAASALPLGAIGSELDLSATVGSYRWTNATAQVPLRVTAWGDYWQFGATVPYQIFNARLSLGVSLAGGENAWMKARNGTKRENPLAARRAVVTLAYTHTF